MFKRFKRLELYIAKGPWDWGRQNAPCGCFIFDLGPIGITWLGDECLNNDSGIEPDNK